MSSDASTDPKQQLSHVVQKQIAIFGSQITAQQLRGISGMTVDLQGNITQFTETPQAVAKHILDSWEQLSPYLAQKIAQPLLSGLLSPETQQTQQQAPPSTSNPSTGSGQSAASQTQTPIPLQQIAN